MVDFKRMIQSAAAPERGELIELLTPWGEALDPSRVLPEHPRPTMVRGNYTMLNGWWDYAIRPLSGPNSSEGGGAGAACARTPNEALADPAALAEPADWDGSVLVPFSPEAPLSGVGRALGPDEVLWYRKSVAAPQLAGGERLILHFEAVDWACTVFVNGRPAASHTGAYLPFDVDATPFIDARAPAFTLSLCVYDPADAGTQLRGKQSLEPGGIWYTAQSGIWQSVWYEVVPETHLTEVRLQGDAAGTLSIEAAYESPVDAVLSVVVADAHGMARARGFFNAPASDPGSPAVLQAALGLGSPHLWSPDDPYLYTVRLKLTAEGGAPAAAAAERRPAYAVKAGTAGAGTADAPTVAGAAGAGTSRENALESSSSVSATAPAPAAKGARTLPNASTSSASPSASADRVKSYCAFRSVCVAADEGGTPRFFLNGRPLFLKGALDQGYWPDGLMTAADDEALVHDIQAAKDLGFNMLRKHIKVESARWYYHADRLGMLVWQDVPSGGGTYSAWWTSRIPTVFSATWGMLGDTGAGAGRRFSSDDAAYRREWQDACTRMVRNLAGHPSVIGWTLFNEGWGQFEAAAAAEHVHQLDPTRPIDATSGWFDQRAGDVLSIHNYFRPLEVPRESGRLQGYAAERGLRMVVLSEFGGLTQPVEGHVSTAATYGYGNYNTLEEWQAAVRALLGQAEALEAQGLAGYVYTQLTDVEGELNGLLTYDRRVNKLQPFGA